MLAAQKRSERARRLAAIGLGKQQTLLAPRVLSAPGRRDDLRVGCPAALGIPSLALRAPSGMPRVEAGDVSFVEMFITAAMGEYYL